MTDELVKQDTGEIVRNVDSDDWTRKLDLIKRTVANGLTDDEFELYIHQAKRSGLDPLSRQIHAIKRGGKDGGKVTIQVGIDGYRLIADRTGKYAGSDDYAFNGTLTEYEALKFGKAPVTATATVYKLVGGIRVPFSATARWDEYCPGGAQAFMWNKMPFLMLGKCAEALALRKAFPAELSGLYTHEEMASANAEIQAWQDAAAPAPKAPKKAKKPVLVDSESVQRDPGDIAPFERDEEPNGTAQDAPGSDSEPNVVSNYLPIPKVPYDGNKPPFTKDGDCRVEVWNHVTGSKDKVWNIKYPDGLTLKDVLKKAYWFSWGIYEEKGINFGGCWYKNKLNKDQAMQCVDWILSLPCPFNPAQTIFDSGLALVRIYQGDFKVFQHPKTEE